MATRPDVIATRTLYVKRKDGSWRPMRIAFERPREQPTSEWGCRYTVDGFDERMLPPTKVIFGVDAVQALEIARAFVERMLMHSRAFAESRLSWSPTSRPHQLGDLPGPMPLANVSRRRIVPSELVRTVELQIDWPLPCVLRVEVFKRKEPKGHAFWTRVWRTDSYKLKPTGSAMDHADETVLVEDSMFSELGAVYEQTPEAAVETTIKQIEWQLFKTTAPKKLPRTRKTKRSRPRQAGKR